MIIANLIFTLGIGLRSIILFALVPSGISVELFINYTSIDVLWQKEHGGYCESAGTNRLTAETRSGRSLACYYYYCGKVIDPALGLPTSESREDGTPDYLVPFDGWEEGVGVCICGYVYPVYDPQLSKCIRLTTRLTRPPTVNATGSSLRPIQLHRFTATSQGLVSIILVLAFILIITYYTGF